MKSSKTKSDNTLSKKAIKRKIKKDLQRAISKKLTESIKNFGINGRKIEKDLSKASKRLAKKLADEFKSIDEDFTRLSTSATAAISIPPKPKQTSLAQAKKVVAKAIKTNNPPKAVLPVKRKTRPAPKKLIASPKSFSNTSTIQSEDTALTTNPIVEKSDVSVKI